MLRSHVKRVARRRVDLVKMGSLYRLNDGRLMVIGHGTLWRWTPCRLSGSVSPLQPRRKAL